MRRMMRIFKSSRSKRSIPKAPVIAGALLFALFGLVSCDEHKATPEWSEGALAAEVHDHAASATDVVTKPRTAAPGLRFMAYNLENWLTMERDGRQSSKPESEKAVAVRLIVESRPDVLGVCEIGDAKDVADLKARLKAAGWEMAHVAYDEDSHALRRLALLSRYPIVRIAEPKVTEYRMNGRNWRMSRPILDATVERENCRYRFVGVHLKSKREVRDADQEEMRIHEAGLLRLHVDEILKADPAVRLIAYGDFNDTRNSVAMKKVAGQYRSPDYLTAIPCGDSQGHRWTHHWDYQDVYSRFDYVLVSAGLKPEVDFRGSYLVDDPAWHEASDHRALLTIFKPSSTRPQSR